VCTFLHSPNKTVIEWSNRFWFWVPSSISTEKSFGREGSRWADPDLWMCIMCFLMPRAKVTADPRFSRSLGLRRQRAGMVLAGSVRGCGAVEVDLCIIASALVQPLIPAGCRPGTDGEGNWPANMFSDQ